MSGPRLRYAIIFVLLVFSTNVAFALPSGPQVANGQVSFKTLGNNLTVTNSPNSIINWLSFSIGGNEAVRFIQQNSASAVLNRITGQSPSQIFGLLQSNGRVFLINPNGILFGKGSQVNVAGLVASTLNINDQDFLAGKYNFTAGAVAGSIQHQGTITTPSGGSVYLIAPNIENSGIITSPQGTVLLAAGHSVQLVDSSNPDIAVVVSSPTDQAVNLGQIIAQSGTVGIYGALISQKGLVSADSATVGANGKIIFKATESVTLDEGSVTSAQGGGTISVLADMQNGTVNVAGTLDASAPNGGNGGFIETSAANVKIADTAYVTTLAPYGKAGTWLIDPTDFTISSGNASQTTSGIGANTLMKDLSLGNMAIQTDNSTGSNPGDIYVNGPVNWSSAYSLTLTAYHDIYINSHINAVGGAGLILSSGTSGNGAISGTGNITAGTLTATAATGISLTGSNVVPIVSLTNNTSGDIIYNSAVGSGQTLYISGRNSASNGAFTVTENSGNLNVYNNGTINGITSNGGLVTLTANTGSINGTGVITANSLTATAATGINLTGNNIVPAVSLTNNTSGDINYDSSVGSGQTLNVSGTNYASGGLFNVTEKSGTLNVIDSCIITNSGAVTLTTSPGAGNITLTSYIDTTNGNTASGAAVYLNSAGSITGGVSGTPGIITANSLTATAANGITLGSANYYNDVQNVSLTNNTSGDIIYNSAVGSGQTLNVSGTNYASGGLFNATEKSGTLNVANAGIKTTGGPVTLTTNAGPITVTGPIDTTNSNTAPPNIVTLNSAGGTSGSGKITAKQNTTTATDTTTTDTATTTPATQTAATAATDTTTTDTATTDPSTTAALNASTEATATVVSTTQSVTTTIAVTPALPTTSNQSVTASLVDSSPATSPETAGQDPLSFAFATTVSPDLGTGALPIGTGSQSLAQGPSSSGNGGSGSSKDFDSGKGKHDTGGTTSDKGNHKSNKTFCN